MPRPAPLLLALLAGPAGLAACAAADVTHPGTITFRRNGTVERVEQVEDVPEGMRFHESGAGGSRRRVPVVEVDARDAGPGRLDELLQATVGFTGSPGRPPSP